MEKAWRIYCPKVDLETAIRNLPKDPCELEDACLTQFAAQVPDEDTLRSRESPIADDVVQQPSSTTMEHSNADDFEFDESQDAERSIDGMAFLTADPHKAGYTGPQSGIAALKFLQSLPPYLPISYSSPLTASDEKENPEISSPTPAAINHYIDEYFSGYHPAYPTLHEGTFRARVSGMLCC